MMSDEIADLQARAEYLEMYAWSSDYGMRAYLTALNELAAARTRGDRDAMAREFHRIAEARRLGQAKRRRVTGVAS
jgi:hypothetical protein